MTKIVKVVAALIRKNGKILICKRPKNKARGLLWEFVGGKVEKGESEEQALIRECFEELGVSVKVFDKYYSVIHEYPDITVDLSLFNAKILSGEIELKEHCAMAWVLPCELKNYEFCPADTVIIERLAQEG